MDTPPSPDLRRATPTRRVWFGRADYELLWRWAEAHPEHPGLGAALCDGIPTGDGVIVVLLPGAWRVWHAVLPGPASVPTAEWARWAAIRRKLERAGQARG